MSMKNRCKHVSGHGPHKRRRGPSSYWMHDADLVFDEIGLKTGDSFLDLGCGPGDYSIRASEIVGDTGIVHALDKWKYLVDDLTEEAYCRGLANIRAMVCDITESLPIEDDSVDLCLLATALHTFNSAKNVRRLFSEIHRVLKPSGHLAIIECKKEDRPFGPPKEVRLSHEQVEHLARPFGLRKINLVDLGNNYLILFRIE